MARNLTKLAIVFSVSLLTILPARATTVLYSITDLGTLGGNQSVGYGINDAGEATGGSRDESGFQHAFVNSGGTMNNLGTLGGLTSNGYGINATGEVTGWSYSSSQNVQRAFIYSGGAMNDLGTLGGIPAMVLPSTTPGR